MLDLTQWTLEQKIGQLFICGFHSLTPDEQITTLTGKYHVGGVVYFRRNVESVRQLATLSHNLQKLPRSHSDIPLIISIDQEGGMVARLDHDGISRIPGNMTLGAVDDLQLTYDVAKLAAEEMLALGINMNFAPCIDVNNNPANPVIGVRSFGEDPAKVAEHGVAATRGYQENGVIATVKHFPGHGDTAVDSHLGLAVVPHDKERLHQIELLPFRKAIEAGADAVMTAHVIFPAFETEEIPATLSRRVLTELLREEMGFNGVIVTDCLEMHAIAKSCGIAEGAVRAIEAGADLVLVSHTLSDQIAAIEAVREAVVSGRISEDRINQSLQRILELKANRIAPSIGTDPLSVPVPLTPQVDSEALLREVAERSVTLVQDSGNLPLSKQKPLLVIWPELRHRTEVDEPSVHQYTLLNALQSYSDKVSLSVIGTRPDEGEVLEVLKRSTDFEQIVVVTYTAEGEIPEGQSHLVNALNRMHGASVVVISTRNPYDVESFKDVGTYICLYENRQFSLDAVAKVLMGEFTPQGKLPVSLKLEGITN
ncbi:beta-N-acetylhexosaminidase [Paenibacillus motobuensis]|uniref:beta-N-acetylhexosaminidase n=1 Tax=Paenibacillus TaxID=44249 RepID=UPI00203FB9C1|nr:MULTISPECIES: beta-N-acetylhexosaminidase [Paenibacillus]MCM3040278.1 beta-N-acetylhexosaminidase [Paenibacillus lutimineralis]MCM3647382.1 beta-N-acetylhexosaminidase [Paenibacillus motobuensis]